MTAESVQLPGGPVGVDAAEGCVHPDFTAVADTFARQLGRTSGGAAVCVYHRGEVVVDLWGGRRDGGEETWTADTLAMCFSTTKGVASTALHICADRGLVDYDEPVATYWPEFAQNGKDRILVRHVMSHSAGLHGLRAITRHANDILDWDTMVAALAAAGPAYPPGTRAGYHAITYGWLVGEIVRRVSDKPLDVFVREDLCDPLGIDGIFLGCPPDERHRIAPLKPMGVPRGAEPLMGRAAKRVGKPLGRAASAMHLPVNPRRLINAFAPRGIEDVMWGSEMLDAVVPAVNGFLSARGLARMYAMLAGSGSIDGVRLLSPETVAKASTVQNRSMDLIVVMPMCWRLGYHMVGTTRGIDHEGFGHFGFGGSGGWADPSRQLAVAMVCNRGTGSPMGDLRLLQLGADALTAARTRPPAESDGHASPDSAAAG